MLSLERRSGKNILRGMSVPPRRIQPGPGQESVWDYPRPPRVETCRRHIKVEFNGLVVAETTRAKRVLETSQPPAYYIPPEDVRLREHFQPTGHTTVCEWKGVAHYYTITVDGRTAANAAWYYPEPAPGFEAIKDHVAVYPGRVEACYVDGEKAEPQEGDFYGGWITKDVVGPFKGGPGTQGW
jgi:uncharacterized protein (DUF427 family)